MEEVNSNAMLMRLLKSDVSSFTPAAYVAHITHGKIARKFDCLILYVLRSYKQSSAIPVPMHKDLS
jgi:hypothetical protein